MKCLITRSRVLFLALLVLTWAAQGAVSDYTQEDWTDKMGAGWPKSSAKVYYWHKDTEPLGKAWVIVYDLTDKHWRFTTRLGKTNVADHDNRLATLKTMAGELENEGRKPLAAINGNYFTYPQNYNWDGKGEYPLINLYGALVSDYKVLANAWNSTNLLVQTADQTFSFQNGVTVKQGMTTRPKLSDGRKIRNATGFYTSPGVRWDADGYHGPASPKQSDYPDDYPRSMIGIGDNILVMFVSDGRHADWSYGVLDEDAARIVASYGCHTVAENDGGGSAGMWIKNLPSNLDARYSNYPQHAEFINRTDGGPRTVAEGIFMLYEDEFVERVQTTESGLDKRPNPYETLEEALEVVETGEKVEILKPVELTQRKILSTSCSISATNAEPIETPILLAEGAELIVNATVKFRNVAVTEANGTDLAMVRLGLKGTVTLGENVWIKGFVTQTADGFVLSENLANPIVVDCLSATNESGMVFGKIGDSVADELVINNLDKLLHPTRPELVAVVGANRSLQWKLAVVTRNDGANRYGDFKTAALRAVEGDTLKLLRPASIDSRIALGVSCTLTADGADARDTALTKAWSTAELAVAKPARVLLTHFAAPEMDVEVAEGAVVALAGDVYVKGIVPAGTNCVELAGALTEPVVIDTSAFGTEVGTVFGTVASDVSDEDAAAGAAHLRNLADDEIAGEVFTAEDGRRLIRWGVAAVADASAVAWVVKDGERTNYASLRMLFGLLDGSADIFIASNCTLSAAVTIPAVREVRMQAAEGTSPVVTADLSASFTVEGSMVVSNLAFVGVQPQAGSGRAANLFSAAGELTFGSGAEIRHIVGCTGTSVVFIPSGGSFKMSDGSVITGCEVSGGTGDAYSAVVKVKNGGTFDFSGGSIFGCTTQAGAIYAEKTGYVNVSGSATVADNVKTDGSNMNLAVQQITLTAGQQVLSVVGELTGRIGVNDTRTVDTRKDKPIGLASAEAGESVTNVVCDSDETCVGARRDDGKLVWSVVPPPPEPPRVQIGETTYPALAEALNAATNGAVLELLRPIEAVCPNERIVIDRRVTIRAAGDPEAAVIRRVPRFLVTYDIPSAITVAAGGDVTLENVILGDDAEDWPVAFVKVDEGGRLTLGEGAVIRNVRCGEFYNEYNPLQPVGEVACAVFSQGLVAMESGSLVTNCVNTYRKSQCGGVLASGIKNAATFDFRGGAIVGCAGGKGGGATIVNGARVYVGGDGEIVGNAPANLSVSGQWQVELTNEFSGVIGHTFIGSAVGDRNIFASVERDVGGDWEPLVEEAAHFTNDLTKALGIATTNAALEAKYVWRTAFTTGPTYTDNLERAWTAIGELPLMTIPVPVAKSGLVYDGKAQSGVEPSPDGFYVLSGDLVATNAGTYVVTATPAYRFVWEGGSAEPTNILWTIAGEAPQPTSVPVPTAISPLVYNGAEQTGAVVSVAGAYTLVGNVGTNAGSYTATATLCDGFVWQDKTVAPKSVAWQIAKAQYQMPQEIVFTNCTYVYDGHPKLIAQPSYRDADGSPAGLPAGVVPSMSYTRTDGQYPDQIAVGEYSVVVSFVGPDTENYEPISVTKTATMTIIEAPLPPEPQWDVVTNHPSPIAFKAINRISDTEWQLVITDRVEYCNYRLIWTTDLQDGFTSTGEWEHAVGPASAPVWTTNVITTGGAWFWRAEGADGTNMVPHVEN